MRITQVTRVSPDIDPGAALELSVGNYDDVTTDWYQAEITSLQESFDTGGIKYLEYTLMRKSLGDAANGLLVSLVTLATLGAFELLKAWLPARQGRKVRVKFKDGSEIEAATVKELEQVRDKFLAHVAEQNDDEG